MSETSARSTNAVASSNKNNNIILITTTSRAERNFYVTQMRANFSIEGMEPSSDDLAMQQGYVDGTVSLAGMLEHARNYVRASRNAEVPKNGSSGFPCAEELPPR